MKDKRKREAYSVLLVLLIIGISLGYAALSSTLNFNGFSHVKNNTWDVHFNNVQINSNSVTLSAGDQAATINPLDTTEVTYSVTLQKPGDFYEFTVDAVNAGTIDAMIGTITSKLNGTVIDSEHPLPVYLDYSLTYSDDIPIANNHLLEAGDTETYKVRLEFKRDIDEADLPGTDITPSFSFGMGYLQASSNSVVRPTRSFENDSWETIVSNVHNNTIPDYYTVGSTKEVDLGALGTHTLRIANTSTPAECSTTGFSQSSCGFVLEFADIIMVKKMNNNHTNIGGWRDCLVRTFLNTDIYSALPLVTKNAIIDTTVVSGYGEEDEEADGLNFITTDKIYLLDAKEVYGDTFTDSANTAKSYERQLDYYRLQGVTTSNLSRTTKQFNGSNYNWWLRSADYYNLNGFFLCNSTDSSNTYPANSAYGVSPAFRIG